jgi:hypothetical protein
VQLDACIPALEGLMVIVGLIDGFKAEINQQRPRFVKIPSPS